MITSKTTHLKALAILSIVLGLAVTACGGTSGGGGGGGGGGDADVGAAEQAIPGEEYTPEYLQGQSTCTIQTLDEIAKDFEVKPEPKIVAREVAKSIEPKAGKKQDLVYRGCLVVLEAPAG